MSGTQPIVNIPDLRVEQIFRKSLEKNAKSFKEKKITWKIVLYTVFTDMIVGQFVSGFLFSFGLLISTPYIRPLMRSGQSFGIQVKRNVTKIFSAYNMKHV